jgi:hypothetical protein
MLSEDPLLPTTSPFVKHAVPYIVAVVIGGTGLGFAVHEHHAAQTMAVQNEQVTAALNATHNQLDALTAKVNDLAAHNVAPPAAPVSTPAPIVRAVSKPHAGSVRARGEESRFKKLQSQVDAQGKEIEETRNNLESTQGDLNNTRTELTGSIARTHDELVVLEKRGERSYFEFDIQKAKDFQHEGPVGISLRKANTKHQYADLQLMLDDRNLTQKHVNLYQPVMFYQTDSPQPLEIVINAITKDHIHGYVSAPKYKQSELTAMSSAATTPASGPGQAANAGAQPAPAQRQKLPVPQQQ